MIVPGLCICKKESISVGGQFEDWLELCLSATLGGSFSDLRNSPALREEVCRKNHGVISRECQAAYRCTRPPERATACGAGRVSEPWVRNVLSYEPAQAGDSA
jgi:hypothetical protein